MNTLLTMLAVLAGTVAGSLADPINGVMVAILVWFAYRGAPWYSALVIAAITTVIHVNGVWSWWQQVGVLSGWQTKAAWIFAAKLVIAYASFGVTRFIMARSRRRV